MTNCKRWEIILVPFPFTDLTSFKRRPALVVSPDSYNADKDVVIAYMTSQMVVSPKIGDYKLQEWKAAGLPKPSIIRMKFATIDQTIVIKTIGEIEAVDREEIEKVLISFSNHNFR